MSDNRGSIPPMPGPCGSPTALGDQLETQAKQAGCFTIVGVVVLVAVLGFVLNWLAGTLSYGHLRSFKPHMQEYVKIANLQGPGQGNYITGKVIPIDPDKRRVNRKVYKLLPRELRARRPEEVGTIMWVTLKDGVYDVTLIDKARALVVWKKAYETSVRVSDSYSYKWRYKTSSQWHYETQSPSYANVSEFFFLSFCRDFENRWYYEGQWRSIPNRGYSKKVL